MCCVKLAYSEAILVNHPNSVKSEFLQGDARFHRKLVYSLPGPSSHCFQKPWCTVTDSSCAVIWGLPLKGAPEQSHGVCLVSNDCWHILSNISN